MKKYVLIFFLLYGYYQGIGQTLTVLDYSSLQPIFNASIHCDQPAYSSATNNKGQADIAACKGAALIIISYVGYHDALFSYDQLASMNFRVIMTEKVYSLDEVVISSSKFEEKQLDVVQQVQGIKAREIQFMNQPTTADLIQQSGNVMVQKSQLGGGSPIIRGFEANKVLLVVDGVRMNNAIYRGGHLQNTITLDNSALENVEIVFGPGSVVYGSDALGGVMHFFTKSPQLSSDSSRTLVKANAIIRYGSAASELAGHVDFNIGFRKIAFFTSFTYSDFDDLRQGNNRNPFYGDWGKRFWYVERINGIDSMLVNDDPNLQIQSGYRQYDFLEKVLFRQNERMSHILNFQYSTSTDVPRYDRLTQTSGDDPKYGQWYYGPQERIFGSYTLQLSGHQGMYDQARIVAGYQHIEESRHDRRYRKDILNNRIEKVEVATLNADFSKILGRHEFRYGVEGTYNYVGSTAFTEDIMTGETGPLDTRYPDGGSSMTSAALYATDNFEINSKLILNAGLRYNYVGLHAEFIDTTFFPFPFHEITQKNNALTGNIGLIILPGDEWRLSVLGSSGFRVPNVDDLSKVFESVPGSVIVPNPDLEPEYTYNGEISLSKGFNDRIRLEGIAFYTLYRNAITTAVSTFDGQDSIYYNGELSQVITNVNANSGYLYGASASLEADVSDHFAITSTLNYTYGRLNTDTTDYPLDHIPPIFGKTSLILKINKFRGEFYSMYSGWKDVDDYNLVGEDNFANATEYGMPAWVTFNVRATYQINRFLQVSAALENIADQNYRVFASNISAPGRNLIVTLKGSF